MTNKPPFRKLRGYAFDPSLSLKMDTVGINNIIYKVPWEEIVKRGADGKIVCGPDKLPLKEPLKEGPVGEYLEVIDYDPTTKKFYTPVNLNDNYILAQDGLEPSESNPQFHQQMVYAVAMTTIKNFESAMGRPILWSPRKVQKAVNSDDTKKTNGKKTKEGEKKFHDEFVGTLRIYPHAMRDANAFYSPEKKALLFGYFSSQPAEITMQMPNSLIFTCLSHDIIAHETTHAILDGLYRKYIDDTNPDVLAFHEAFSDIVALFQHFTFPDVLKSQIAKTRGDLTSQNLLGQLAQQFGTAIGHYGALRDAIGAWDENEKKWKQKEPDGNEYITETEPHARGSILVSAVFDAFLAIYKSRVSDLLRIASGGSGILPQGELHPDLVNRLANEAAKSAGHVLKMCIRALDYCPPVDLNFGDYLRAIITADTDLISDDNRDYRLAFIDAFRKRGIYPSGIKNLSVESLAYSTPDTKGLDEIFEVLSAFLREYRNEIIYKDNRQDIFNTTRDYIAGRFDSDPKILGLHRRINIKFDNSMGFEKLTGMIFNPAWTGLGIGTSTAYAGRGPSFEVHSLHCASRVGPNGNQNNQIIVTLLQRANVTVENNNNEWVVKTADPANSFQLTGGCTLIFDLNTMELKYAISKPLLDIEYLKKKNIHRIDEKRAIDIYKYQHNILKENEEKNIYKAYFGLGNKNVVNEPFSFLHNH